MTDELLLPQVPEPIPEDPEDVSWALSTAEAIWARGDHAEGIKWVRRAAEAASEAERDERALQLAKAAAELTGLISRQTSLASIEIEEIIPVSEEPAAPAPAPPPVPTKATGKNAAAPKLPGKPVNSPSRPPAPLPSRTSQPPPGASRTSQVPRAGANKPLGTNTTKRGSMPPASKRSPRRSRENLEAEARAGIGAAETAPQPPIDAKGATGEKAGPGGFPLAQMLPSDTAETAAVHVPHRREAIDPTQVSHVNDIVKESEWDHAPTQNLTGEDLPFGRPGDLKTTLQSFPRPAGKPAQAAAPVTVAGPAVVPAGGPGPGLRGTPADPGIVTTQAVRVVVWRDASGVHVAPAGTVVSAIKVDAVLVALEPNADLTAWLSARETKR